MRSLCRLALLGMAVGLAAGCGSAAPPTQPGSATVQPTGPTATTQTPTASPTPTSATPSPAPTWPATERTAPASHAGSLTAISVGRHPGYDRVVFTFRDGIPGYRVGYVPEVIFDPRGDAVPLAGRAYLRVLFRPASGYRTYSGPGTISPVYPTLLQVRAAGDFESYLSFGIGLSQRTGFRVFTLTEPYRVVVDVARASLPRFPGIWDITSWPQFWRAQVAFIEGHQPWRASGLLVVRAWAAATMPGATVRQTGPDTFAVTQPATGKHATITGTRPVTVGQARLWVITSIRR